LAASTKGVSDGFVVSNLHRYHKETHETVAIKVIDLDYAEDDVDDIMKEIAILAQLNSKYVTRWHTVCEIVADRRYFGSYVKGSQLWIVMEYCGGASCADLVLTDFVLSHAHGR